VTIFLTIFITPRARLRLNTGSQRRKSPGGMSDPKNARATGDHNVCGTAKEEECVCMFSFSTTQRRTNCDCGPKIRGTDSGCRQTGRCRDQEVPCNVWRSEASRWVGAVNLCAFLAIDLSCGASSRQVTDQLRASTGLIAYIGLRSIC